MDPHTVNLSITKKMKKYQKNYGTRSSTDHRDQLLHLVPQKTARSLTFLAGYILYDFFQVDGIHIHVIMGHDRNRRN